MTRMLPNYKCNLANQRTLRQTVHHVTSECVVLQRYIEKVFIEHYGQATSIDLIINVTALQQLSLPSSRMPMLQRRGAMMLKPFSCCSAITCRVFTL
ncbi:hypothetical protein ABVT39_006503 [Epinephelus coioides]